MRDRNAPLTAAELDGLDWAKMDGLLPVTVQDRSSRQVLMLGYMNREALERTLESHKVTFWSRSRQALWMKGETSGNWLHLSSVHADCDDDALLVLADPQGPTCHLGTRSCFGDELPEGAGWLDRLSEIVAERAASDDESSYSRRLLAEGTGRIAQKIGEEGVEVALAAVGPSNQACAVEVADLVYHVAVLMQSRGFTWSDVTRVLRTRHEASGAGK